MNSTEPVTVWIPSGTKRGRDVVFREFPNGKKFKFVYQKKLSSGGLRWSCAEKGRFKGKAYLWTVGKEVTEAMEEHSHEAIADRDKVMVHTAVKRMATDDISTPTRKVVFFTMSYVLPLTLIVCLYIMMLYRLWGGAAPGGRCSVESRRGKRRVTRMVLVVVAIFAICWCPIQVILVLKSVDLYPTTSTTSVMIQIMSQVLAYINSCVNPILYAFLSENFRKAFRKVIYCGPRGGQHHIVNGRQNEAEKSALTKTTRGNDII